MQRPNPKVLNELSGHAIYGKPTVITYMKQMRKAEYKCITCNCELKPGKQDRKCKACLISES